MVLNTDKKTDFFLHKQQFYTIIPHDFGRDVPPLINNLELLKAKMAQLEALMDIEIANKLMESQGEELTRTHPLDRNYKKLGIEYE